MINADNYNDGIWGIGDSDIEMIAIKVPKGYYVQSRLNNKDKFGGNNGLDGALYDDADEAVGTMKSGANITKFKLWIGNKVNNP